MTQTQSYTPYFPDPTIAWTVWSAQADIAATYGKAVIELAWAPYVAQHRAATAPTANPAQSTKAKVTAKTLTKVATKRKPAPKPKTASAKPIAVSPAKTQAAPEPAPTPPVTAAAQAKPSKAARNRVVTLAEPPAAVKIDQGAAAQPKGNPKKTGPKT